MSVKMNPNDPAYWMLFDGVETIPVIYSPTCYICNDSEFVQTGLPLCRICPVCTGHIAADDTRCDVCGLCTQTYWESKDLDNFGPDELEKCVFVDENYKTIVPGWLQKALLRIAMQKE